MSHEMGTAQFPSYVIIWKSVSQIYFFYKSRKHFVGAICVAQLGKCLTLGQVMFSGSWDPSQDRDAERRPHLSWGIGLTRTALCAWEGVLMDYILRAPLADILDCEKGPPIIMPTIYIQCFRASNPFLQMIRFDPYQNLGRSIKAVKRLGFGDTKTQTGILAQSLPGYGILGKLLKCFHPQFPLLQKRTP